MRTKREAAKKPAAKTKTKAAPKKPAAPSFATVDDRVKSLLSVVDRHPLWQPAADVLTPVRAVPTPIVQLDYATGVGGWPVERISVVHGPSGDGKTALALILEQGFLELAHFALHMDAEQTTPLPWVAQMMGDLSRSPLFRACRPDNYEQAVDIVGKFAHDVTTSKQRGDIPPDTSGIIVVDSIRKLVPKNLMDALLKEGASGETGRPGSKRKVGIDGMAGRAAQYKAALNTQWMDSCVPLMAKSGLAMVLIARETEKEESSDFWSKRDNFKVGGGVGVNYDASLRGRVVGGGAIFDGEGKDRVYYGDRHVIEIHKTKIGQKFETRPTANFYTSNGVLVPAGFDRARGVVELAVELGVMKDDGARFKFDGKQVGHGRHDAVRRLSEAPELLRAVEAATRASFRTQVEAVTS